MKMNMKRKAENGEREKEIAEAERESRALTLLYDIALRSFSGTRRRSPGLRPRLACFTIAISDQYTVLERNGVNEVCGERYVGMGDLVEGQ